MVGVSVKEATTIIEIFTHWCYSNDELPTFLENISKNQDYLDIMKVDNYILEKVYNFYNTMLEKRLITHDLYFN